jgi:uncharacterized protein
MKDQTVTIYRGNERLFAKVKLARTFGAKWRGLMFYPELPAIDGLLLCSCHSVHMFWMRFPLALIYLSREREVIFTVNSLAPNKLGPSVKAAFYVLEAQAGTVAAKNIRVGDRIWWE